VPVSARREPLRDYTGRAIWLDGKNIIIRDPTSLHWGTAFSKKTVEAAVGCLEDEPATCGRAP
jgi:hypothetical protein